ncbi:unnamed protein product, partial [Prorocentrum cordatum]
MRDGGQFCDQVTYKQALLGPTKREAAMQKKLDAMREELWAFKDGNQEKPANEEPQVDLARLFKWAQSCKQERGEDSEGYQVALEKYQAARTKKDTTKPPAAQLTQARYAREKLEKETESLANDEAKARLEKKQEQLQIARANGIGESPALLPAMQKQFEGAVDCSGISKQEYEQVVTVLGKVLANAKQEDMRVRTLKHDTVTPMTYNGSGCGTIKDKIMEEMLEPQCYAVQEHHPATDKLAVVTQSMKMQGYHMGGAAAVATTGPNGEAGTSAGVALAVPKRVGMAYLYGKDDRDISPKASPGTAAAAWPSIGKGAVLATVVLWTAEGMTHRNTQLIAYVIGKLQSLGGPWVIGGDFQVVPRVMAEVESVKVQHIEIQESWPAAPHKPVGPTIKLKVVERKVRVLEKPRALPEAQIGRAPAPPSYEHVQEFKTQEPKWRIKPLKFGGENVHTAAREATWWRWLTRPLHGLQGAHPGWRGAKEPDMVQKRCHQMRCQEKLFQARPRRVKYISAKGQGIWQARCDTIAAGQLRGGRKEPNSQSWMQEAGGKMKAVDQRLLRERQARWADELAIAAAGAAGGLDKLSKAATAWRPRRADTTGKAADPLEAAEYAFEEWKVVRRVGEKLQEEPRPWGQEPRQELADLKEEDVDRLKEGACDEACSRLLDILRVVDCTLAWPIHMATVLFFIIPKTLTTDRAIGLLPATIRAREIMKGPHMIKGAMENQRSWDCTNHGAAAEDAACDALLSHEMDDPDDESEELEATITAVLDLVKAFEKVSLHVLWLIAGGPALSETSTVATIIAGSKCSVRFLKMVIQSTVDGLVVEGPRAKWRMHVDDIRVRLRQKQQYFAQEFSDTIDACFASFIKLSIKTAAKDMARRGLPVVRACPHLGVDLITHGAAAKAKSGKRYKGMLSSRRRLANLKGGGRMMATGTTLVSKCGLKRSVRHGCQCHGMPDQQLRQLRPEAGRALSGGRRAKSPMLQLALAGEEPTLQVTEAPIIRWAREVWQTAPAKEVNQQWDSAESTTVKAWRRQQQEVGMKPMWAKVRGPAGAVIMSLRRAQWPWPAWHTAIAKTGYTLDMLEVCPTDVAAMLREDVQQQLWEDLTKAEEYAGSRPAPMVAPAAAQLLARDAPEHAENAARCSKCTALRELRLKAQPEWQTVAEQQKGNLLWTRGLVRHPEVDWTFIGIAEGQYMCQAVEEGEDHFTGDIVCDGSKLGHSEWAQTGWAAMSVNEEGKPKYQMWSFYEELEHKLGDGKIYTDHEGTMKGLREGEKWRLSWK